MTSRLEDKAEAAIREFNTPSNYLAPFGYPGPRFELKNDYPHPISDSDHSRPITASSIPGDAPALPLPDVPVKHPWTKIDFTIPEGASQYAQMVKDYCWEGNRSVDFVVKENTVRSWFHAPWMHASTNGREPLKGLTYERSIPQWELAANQKRALQNWAIGFYNAPGASVFGGVWENPAAPVWDDDLKFPKGTVVFKLLFTTATDEEVPTMKGSPGWMAMIAKQENPAKAPRTAEFRVDSPKEVRLIQVDWATVDHRSPIGWVFGTFMYNGTLEHIADPWDRLTSIGVTWGNDPQLDQAAFNRGKTPVECWINPVAEELRKSLGGARPSWGYHGRLNGPADNFVSACASCHGTAQSFDAPLVQDGKLEKLDPGPDGKKRWRWVPLNERITMTWFQNVKAGETFSIRGARSADYSLQFTIGWSNFKKWWDTYDAQQKEKEAGARKRTLLALPTRRVVFRSHADGPDEEKMDKLLAHITVEEEPRRAGPDLDWS